MRGDILKKYFLYIIISASFCIGFSLGVVLLNFERFSNMLFSVNWSSITYWLTLFLGASIPIFINYFSMKHHEVNKIKGQLASDKIDIIRSFGDTDFLMRATNLGDKTKDDMNIDYSLDEIDKSSPYLRGLIIFNNHELYNNWKVKLIMHFEKFLLLQSKEVNDYVFYIRNYLVNLDHYVERVLDEDLWEIGIVVRNDFMQFSSELNEILSDFMHNEVFKLKHKRDSNTRDITQNEINAFMSKTKLVKHKTEIENICSVNR